MQQVERRRSPAPYSHYGREAAQTHRETRVEPQHVVRVSSSTVLHVAALSSDTATTQLVDLELA